MKKVMILALVLSMGMAVSAQRTLGSKEMAAGEKASKEQMKAQGSQGGVLAPTPQNYMYAEIVETFTDKGSSVMVNADWKSMTKNDPSAKSKMGSMKGSYNSALEALNALCQEGWEYVDQSTYSADKGTNRVILIRKSTGPAKGGKAGARSNTMKK